MPSSIDLLVEQLRRDALEEQVDREDDDHEIVEPAEDRDVVRDEVAPEDEVPGRAGEQRLASGGIRSSASSSQMSRVYMRRAAGERA